MAVKASPTFSEAFFFFFSSLSSVRYAILAPSPEQSPLKFQFVSCVLCASLFYPPVSSTVFPSNSASLCCCHFILPLVVSLSLSLRPPERSLDISTLWLCRAACGVLMCVWVPVKGKVLAQLTCFAASVHMSQAEREGKAMLHVLLAQWECVCVVVREGGRYRELLRESEERACVRERGR